MSDTVPGKISAVDANYIDEGPEPFVCGNCAFVIYGGVGAHEGPGATHVDYCQLVHGPLDDNGGIAAAGACRLWAHKEIADPEVEAKEQALTGEESDEEETPMSGPRTTSRVAALKDAAAASLASPSEPCADCGDDDDHFGSTNSSVTDKKWDGAASRFTDDQYERAAAACDAGDQSVKSRCFLPHHEPDGTTNRNGVHAAAQRVSSLSGHDAAAVSRAKAHLRSHYAQLKEDPPESIAAAVDDAETLAHAPMDGTHSHAHPAYGAQGDDASHSHEHMHDGDASHDHAHEDYAVRPLDVFDQHPVIDAPLPLGLSSFVAAATEPRLDLTRPFDMLGAPWAIQQVPVPDSDATEWRVLAADGSVPWTATSQQEALAHLAEVLAAESDRPTLAERWQGPMAFEGVSTGDGRRILSGAIEFRPTPLPLMLQTTTDIGHYGAVLAGSIESCGMVGAAATGQGSFDDSDAGRAFRDIIAARDRFGVSIDVAEAEGEFECTARDEYEDCIDGEVAFSLIRVMGLCYDEETEILSEDGWVRFADLPRGVRVATRSKSGEFEWQEPLGYTADAWDGPMIHFRGGGVQQPHGRTQHRTLDLLVTPNHRMLVEETKTGRTRFIRADELAAKSPKTFRIPKTATWSAPDVRTFRVQREPIADGLCACGCGKVVRPRTETLPSCRVEGCDGSGYSDGLCNPHYQRQYRHGDPTLGGPFRTSRLNRRIDVAPKTLSGHGHGRNADPLELDGDYFAALMGAWLAEGSLGSHGEVNIAQQPQSKGYPRYLQTFTHEDGWWHDGRKFRQKNVRLADYLRQFGHAKDKFVPETLKNFSARQLWIFWDHYMAGDGSLDGRKAYTSSSRLAGDLQEIAQKLGMWAVLGERTGDGNTIAGRRVEPTGPQYVLAIRNRPGSRPAAAVWDWQAEQVGEYHGMVRCVTVPNESLYVRRNGIPVWCGNTGTPFPAFEAAFIEFAPVVQAASADPAAAVSLPLHLHTSGDEPCDDCDPADELFAAGGPLAPPALWFEDPQLARPTPLTVTAEGRVFGHLATWKSCHTSYADRCVAPPRSSSGYAYFTTGAVTTAEGSTVRVGQLTMGCGHASDSASLGHKAAKAHYDGGPGAVQMADVAIGEDDIGIWFAGGLRPSVTDDQVREFAACALSGDWRQVQRGRGLELVAALSVPVPGFPIAASASPDVVSLAVRTRIVEGETVVLVAAGLVPRPMPWEIALTAQRAEIEELRCRVERAELVTGALRGLAAERLRDSLVLAGE